MSAATVGCVAFAVVGLAVLVTLLVARAIVNARMSNFWNGYR